MLHEGANIIRHYGISVKTVNLVDECIILGKNGFLKAKAQNTA